MAILRESLAPALSWRVAATQQSSPAHFFLRLALPLALLAMLSPDTVRAQMQMQPGQTQTPVVIGTQPIGGRAYPSPAYAAGFVSLNDGDYKAAFESFRREVQGAYKMPQGRWIDSICGYTMLGESEYRLGHYPAAMDDYKAALQLYIEYGNWMQSVQFSDSLTPAQNNRGAPWGRSTRGSRPARFPDTMVVSIGMNQQQMTNALHTGGTVMSQQGLSIQVQEIIRCTCLAMERRRELLGPVATFDPLTDEVMNVANRRLGKVNHWSEAWLDVQQGMAYAAAGKTAQAKNILQRSLTMAEGQLDHPLTGLALLTLGKLSLESGDYKTAGNYFEEATYSAYDYADLGVMEEAFRNLFLARLMTGDTAVMEKQVAAAIEWSHNHWRELEVSLILIEAENMAIRYQPQAAALLTEAGGLIGRRVMGGCEMGARLNYLIALTQYQHGAQGLAAGDTALGNALLWEREGSRWLYQINLVDNLCVTNRGGKFSLRTADDLYRQMLRDPGPTDWALQPLESLGVMNTPHAPAFEHWFEKIVQESASLDAAAEGALEVADLSRRHRFLSSLPSGGRMLALRWVLEAPEDLLDKTSLLQRQELLGRYPKYAETAAKAKKIRTEIAQGGLNLDAKDATRATGMKLAELATLTATQESMLREIAVRREAAQIVFPPVRKMKEVQQSLPESSLLLAYFNTSHAGYGWFLSGDRITMWKTDNVAMLEKRAVALLRALGNFDANHELQDAQLTDGQWKQSATDLVASLLKNPKTNFRPEFKELVIVPDGLLWYVPFEALPLGDSKENRPLISRLRIRYVPTLALAMPQKQGRKGSPDIGIALDKLSPGEAPDFAQLAMDEISHVASHAVALKNPLPGASSLLASVLDGLIVIDDIPAAASPYEWTPVPLDKTKAGASSLSAWMTLPWKSVDTIVLPGFHTAAENSLKMANTATGNDLFLATTGLMSTGARTILISRWRAGGQSTIDMIREFMQVLPQTSADEAWQRAVQLVSQAPLDALHEPRVKRKADAAPVNADHPFFWAGYLLVDTGSAPPKEEAPIDKPPPKLEAKQGGTAAPDPNKPDGMKKLPDPDKPAAVQKPEDAKAPEKSDG